jgi:uncharacterized protein YndB with AHSA1/START domain
VTIRKSIWVKRSAKLAFQVFCEKMSEWWPQGFAEDSKPSLEPRVGGRFYERRADGTEYEIGRVIAYEPPSLVAFTWRAPSWDSTTQVEIRFSPERDGTRVELEHSGWEQDAKVAEFRKNYDSGWEKILGYYASAVSA